VTGNAHEVWAKARANKDFASFQPVLERIIDLRRQYAGFFAPYDHIYDPLLDIFEPGMKTAEVRQIFAALRQEQVDLVRAITARPQVRDDFLRLDYDDQKQWDFGVEVASRFGFNWDAGRQDRSAHPFTTSFGIQDVRITTRIIPNMVTSAMFSTMHETGHALYQQGFAPSLRRTPLADGASMAVHESQSRMWENLVGRSRAFWVYFYPRLQSYFPEQLGGVDLETFYKAINKVEPSFIRVEADEVTYNYHIMLRVEVEKRLIEGSLKVQDLPEFWREQMQSLLGITPPNDRLGPLQDIHWASGTIGSFPNYTLGNVMSAQFFEAACRQVPEMEEALARADYRPLLAWLTENIYRHARAFLPDELLRRSTGSPLNTGPYLRYLNRKYGELFPG